MKTSRNLVAGLAVAFIGLSSSTFATLVPVSESGFETPDLGFDAFAYGPAGSAWTFAGGAGLTGNGSGFTHSQLAPEGDQVAFLQGQGGTITQTLTGLGKGFYTLDFLAAQRNQLDAVTFQTVNQTFDVFLGGVLMGSFEPGGIAYGALTTSSVFLEAGDHDLQFVGTSLNGLADTTVFIDDLALDYSAVPLAPTSLLMGGLLALRFRKG